MPTEKLYGAALQFKKTKLWKQLNDTELFALKLSGGKTGYCCVMGELGEHVALSLYIGQEGLDSYRGVFEARQARNRLVQHEIFMSQDCLQCSLESRDELSPFELEEAQGYAKTYDVVWGKNGYPQFRKFLPSHYPWFVREKTDEKLLSEALSAAVEISERLKTTDKRLLGFTDGAPYNRAVPFLTRSKGAYQLSTVKLPPREEPHFPSPRVKDELLVARLKMKPKSDTSWACETVMLPNAASDEAPDDSGLATAPVNAPYFPYTLLILDLASEMIIQSALAADYSPDAGVLVTALARAMEEHGIPSEIRVRDKRTERLLGAFARQLDIKIKRCDNLPLLDEIEEDLLARFSGEQSPDEAEATDIFDMLLQMDDETFNSMPPEMKSQLLDLDHQGLLPEPVSARVRQLIK